MLCVNKNAPELKKLAEKYGVKDFVLETLTLVYWQENKMGERRLALGETIPYPTDDFLIDKLRNDKAFNLQEEAKNYAIYPKDVKKVFPDRQPKDALLDVGQEILADQFSENAKKYHLEMHSNSREHRKFQKALGNRSTDSVFENLDMSESAKYPSSTPEHWLKRIVNNNKKKYEKFYNKAVRNFTDSKLDLEDKQNVEDYFGNEATKKSIKILKELRNVEKRIRTAYFAVDIEDKRYKKLKEQLDDLETAIDQRRYDLGMVNFTKDFYEMLFKMEEDMGAGVYKTPQAINYLSEIIAFYEPMLQEVKEYFENKDRIDTEFSDQVKDTLKTFGLKAELERDIDKLKQGLANTLDRLAILKSKKTKLSVNSSLQATLDYIDRTIDDPVIRQQEKDKARKYVTKNDYDDNVLRKMAGSLSKSKDVFMRVFDKKMTDINMQVQNFTLDIGERIYNKAKELGINVSTFKEKITDKDSPHNVITPYDYAETEKKEAKEFEDLNEEFGLPANKDLANETRRLWKRDNNLYEHYMEVTRNNPVPGNWYIVRKGKNVTINKESGKIIDADFEMTIDNYLKSDEYLNSKKDADYANKAKLIKYKYYEPITDKNGKVIAEDIIKQKKKLWGENSTRFQYWISEVKRKDRAGNPYYRGELLVPKKRNKQYDSLSANEKEYLEFLMEIKHEADLKIPFNTQLRRLPQIKSDWVNSVFKKTDKNGLPNIMEAIREGFNFTKDSDDVMFGDEPVRRADGSLAYNVPTHFIREVDDPSRLTNDFIGSIVLYSQMAENAHQKYKVQPEYENMLETFQERRTELRGQVKTNMETTIAQEFDNYMQSQLFGLHKISPKNDTVRLFGREFSLSKMAMKLSDYIRNNNLALRASTALVGMMSSTVNYNLEKALHVHTAKGVGKKAMATYMKYMHLALGEAGKVVKTNKLSKTLQTHLVLEDATETYSNMDIRNKVGRFFGKHKLYSNYAPAEHGIKSNVMLGIMMSYRLHKGKFVKQEDLDKQGVDWKALPTYWDLLSEDGKTFKEKVNDPKQERVDMQTQIRELINDIDGRISPEDRALVHRHFAFQFLGTHRNWLFRQLDNRFHQEGFNYRKGKMEGGYYALTYKFVSNLYGDNVRTLKDAIGRFDTLEKHEQDAVKRTLYEMMFTTALIFLGTLINYLADDDEEEGMASWLLDYTAFLTTRTYIEFTTLQIVPAVGVGIGEEGNPKFITSIAPPVMSQLLEVLQSPVAGVTQIDNFMELTNIMEWGEEVQSGPYEGMLKGERVLLKSFPGGKGLSADRDPSASKQYLLNNALKYWIHIGLLMTAFI